MTWTVALENFGVRQGPWRVDIGARGERAVVAFTTEEPERQVSDTISRLDVPQKIAGDLLHVV
jgi:hypothetical protein